MKLMLNDTIQKPNAKPLEEIKPGQIFIDGDGDYCMKIKLEKSEDGQILSAIVLSGSCIGECVAYSNQTFVIPVRAELTILGYD